MEVPPENFPAAEKEGEQTDEVPDGGAVTFSANLFGDPCPTFVVGVSGYFS